MNADDRKLLKKLIERDTTRALEALKNLARDKANEVKTTFSLDELPVGIRRHIEAVNKSVLDIAAHYKALREAGFEPPKTLAFGESTYFPGHATPGVRPLIPAPISTLALSELTAKTKKDEVRYTFKPKRQQIEQAQADIMLDIMASDLPGVKAQLQHLRALIINVVGAEALAAAGE